MEWQKMQSINNEIRQMERDNKEGDNKMKGVKKFEVEIADKVDNKGGVVDALMKRYHVCEEVAEAMVWESLCTVKGLEYLFNDLEKNSKLERRDLR